MHSRPYRAYRQQRWRQSALTSGETGLEQHMTGLIGLSGCKDFIVTGDQADSALPTASVVASELTNAWMPSLPE